jgi:Flp pilus assembly protein TadD
MFEAVAAAYCAAAHAGADMHAATTALEMIRAALSSGEPAMSAWAVVDEQIGRADLTRLLPALVELRDDFQRHVIADAVQRLRAIDAQSPQDAWRSWVGAYVESFSDAGWRVNYSRALANEALPADLPPDWPAERIERSAHLVFGARWAETFDWFMFLAEQELPDPQRARVLAIASQIQLFHFEQRTRARQLLDQARALAPSEITVLRAQGEHALATNDLDEARRTFEQIVQQAPTIADGIIGLGDYYEKSSDMGLAEYQFQTAILEASGQADSYSRALDWHGRTEWYKERKSQIAPLFQRLLALDDNQAQCWVKLGVIHAQNYEVDAARTCYDQAITLDPSRISAYVQLGHLHLNAAEAGDEAEYTRAAAQYQHAVDLEPLTLDGYWAMLDLHTRRSNWELALEWCDRAFLCGPEWEMLLRARRGELLCHLERYPEAEADIARSLTLESDNPTALDALSGLADAAQDGAPEITLRSLQTLRLHKGEAYEHTYQNRIGNLRYYHGEYLAAAEAYGKAIAARPTDAVLHSNLALALEHLPSADVTLDQLDETIAALRTAMELDPQESSYGERLAALQSKREFVVAYGADALLFEPGVVPIRVEVDESIFPYILEADGVTLSAETRAHLTSMRTELREKYGVVVPGVNFRGIDSSDFAGWYQITIAGEEVTYWHVVPGSDYVPSPPAQDAGDFVGDETWPPPGYWTDDRESGASQPEAMDAWSNAEYLIRSVRHTVTPRLALLVGHEETASLLDECVSESARTIRGSLTLLTPFVQVLKELLERQLSIAGLDAICEEFLRLHPDTSNVFAIADVIGARLIDAASANSRGPR